MKTLNALVIADDNMATTNFLACLKQKNIHPFYIKPGCSKVHDVFIDLDIDIVFLRFKYWDEELRSVLYMLKNPPRLVFLSSESEKFTDYLSEEFPLHLKEPYKCEQVDYLLRELEKHKDEDFRFLIVKYQRRYRKIPFRSIQQITSKGAYVTIHTRRENFMIAYSMNKLKHKLPEEEFVQANSKLILSRNRVSENS